jgi:hypothetical protein
VSGSHNSPYNYYFLNKFNFLSKSNLLNKSNSEFYIDGYNNALPTKNPFFNLTDYDSFNKPYYNDGQAFLFLGDNETLPSNIHTSGFNTNYFNNSKNIRLYSNLIYLFKTINYT